MGTDMATEFRFPVVWFVTRCS